MVILVKAVKAVEIEGAVRVSIRGLSWLRRSTVDNLHAKEKVRVLSVAFCCSMVVRC